MLSDYFTADEFYQFRVSMGAVPNTSRSACTLCLPATRAIIELMRRRVTITFDNGPTPEVTPYVLDCLAKNKVPATFFVIGCKASSPKGTAILQRASEEGHSIGNHTFTHTTPLGELDGDAALREFEQAEEALAWLKRPRRLFRPYGRAGTLRSSRNCAPGAIGAAPEPFSLCGAG